MSTSQIVVALLAVTAGALLKSISGVGLPLVSIPVISYVSGIEQAIAITALPNLVLNTSLAWQQRSNLTHTRDLPVLGGFGFLGALVGTTMLISLPEEPLIALMVALVLAYAALHVTSPSFAISPTRSKQFAPAVGIGAGAMQGAIGISGPVVGAWIHGYRLEPKAQILSVAALFSIAGVAQLPVLAMNGQIHGLWLVTLFACVPAICSIPAGTRLRDRLSSGEFEHLVVAILALSALGLGLRTFT